MTYRTTPRLPEDNRRRTAVEAARRTIRVSPPPNVPYFLALFLASPKKKGEKEGRRSARGRFFREPPQGRKCQFGGLWAPQAYPCNGDERINTEKPPSTPPDGREVEPEGPPQGFAVVPPIAVCFAPRNS